MGDRVRTIPSEEFATGGIPIERFAAPADPNVRKSEVELWAEAQMEQAGKQRMTPLGQISQIWLHDRDVDFVRSGPMLALNQAKQLIIPTPVFSLPPRKVLVDRKGRPIWNAERMSAAALAGATIKEMSLPLESYADAKTRDGRLYVLQPLTQIFFKTVDMQRRPFFVNFLPGEQGSNAALLYDPAAHTLQIWGGEFFQFA